ncbi:MAG: tRNA pseudouridine(38-40) synthase TruA [Candidatus Thermoplasmatota archaeon]|nr:tRNA pseudouridine(38-40) synthase TruA [Candidatus Thermoplasmatota archaeon]
MRLALKFAYDGKSFFGYAKQPNLRTVEGEIINALKKTKIVYENFQSASRTDRGVSALGNVVAFNTDFKGNVLSALNANTKNIYFYAFAKVDEDFNPRYAKERWYRYFLFNDGFDVNRMKKASGLFVGVHDFTNFARAENRNPIRRINSLKIKEKNNFIILDIRAESFLWNMVRRIVSSLEKVGKKEIRVDVIKNALESKERFDSGLAEPEGLILRDVKYDFDFEKDGKVIEKVKQNLSKRFQSLKSEENILEHLLKL